MIGRTQHVKRRWLFRENWPGNIAAKYTGPVSTCTSDIINTQRRRHRAVQLSPRWRDGLHMSTDADGFTRTERFSAPFRSQLPVDRCHLATLPIWPSAVTVETCAQRKHPPPTLPHFRHFMVRKCKCGPLLVCYDCKNCVWALLFVLCLLTLSGISPLFN